MPCDYLAFQNGRRPAPCWPTSTRRAGRPVCLRDNTRGVYLNTGSGWSTFQTGGWYAPAKFYDGSLDKDTGARLVDLNGDGLPDILQGRFTTMACGRGGAWLNTGSGWGQATNFSPPVALVRDDFAHWGTEIADVNGDGLPTWCMRIGRQRRDQGDVAEQRRGLVARLRLRGSLPLGRLCRNTDTNVRAGTALIDLNGDGLPEEIWKRWIGAGNIQQAFRSIPAAASLRARTPPPW